MKKYFGVTEGSRFLLSYSQDFGHQIINYRISAGGLSIKDKLFTALSATALAGGHWCAEYQINSASVRSGEIEIWRFISRSRIDGLTEN
jgi:hypothetical protein